MFETIYRPLNWLFAVCCGLLHNYALAIVLFTLLTKIILFPVSIWTGRNSLKMVALMPELNRLKIKYYGDKATIAEETQNLYRREHYHPLVSLIPMCVQLLLLGGVIGAVREVLGQSGGVLTQVPSQAGGLTYLMPLVAGSAALLLGISQNHLNPLQREQTRAEQLTTNGFSIAISLVLGVFVPLGVGMYWIASNLFSILQQVIINAILPPVKYVDYEKLSESRRELSGMDSLSAHVSKEDKRREKADFKRFFSVANKHLVFYSESSGFYKYFQDVIEYLLTHSNVIIHYVTNDSEDRIFGLAKQQPRIRPYYISQNKAITLFMKMDADIVVMTTPGLENYYLKRSYVRKDVEYIYMFHGLASTTMVVPKASYDHFDTIFCGGQHHIDELREAEKIYGTKEKTLVPCGYGLFDNLILEYQKQGKVHNPRPKILIAPSWQEDNIMDSAIDVLLAQLLGSSYDVVVRPHPEYIKRYFSRIKSFLAKYQNKIDEHFTVETDFSANTTIFMADLVVTDWSGIAYEFSFSTLQPSLFIDTPMKVLNPEYTKYKELPTDLTWRNQVGIALSLKELGSTGETVEKLLSDREIYREKIASLRGKSLFNIGKSGEAGGRYILGRLTKKSDHSAGQK